MGGTTAGAAAKRTVSGDIYAVRIDDTVPTSIYIGKSPVGSATSDAVWMIKKIDSTSGVSITFADGNHRFDNVWDDRASLTYS